MNYLSYKFNYRYTCIICDTLLEVKTQTPINKKQEPKCVCGNILHIHSYFGPNGLPMYARDII
jgi:hypothetical protein